jgi:hypothetical protein
MNRHHNRVPPPRAPVVARSRNHGAPQTDGRDVSGVRARAFRAHGGERNGEKAEPRLRGASFHVE